MLKLKEKTLQNEELEYELELSGSAVKQHLCDLKEERQVAVIGKNVSSSKEKRKCVLAWSIAPRK